MAGIVVVGSYNRDVVLRVSRFPAPGETCLSTGRMETDGGKGSNQAIMAARCGGRVEMLAAVGSDDAGERALALWSAWSVGVQGVARLPDVGTGMAMILVDEAGENLIVVDPGANARLAPTHAKAQADRLRGAALVVAQLETPSDTTATAFALVRAAGGRTLLNAAPATALVGMGALLSATDILVVNEGEGSELTGLTSADAIGEALLGRVGEAVVVTAGPRGATLFRRGAAPIAISPPRGPSGGHHRRRRRLHRRLLRASGRGRRHGGCARLGRRRRRLGLHPAGRRGQLRRPVRDRGRPEASRPDEARRPDRPVTERAWRFSTSEVAEAERGAAWFGVLNRLKIPAAPLGGGAAPEGSVSSLSSPLGMDFAVMRATPQTFAGRNADQRSAVWLVVVLEGDAELSGDGGSGRLTVGDIVYGPTGSEAELRLITPFRLLFVNAPRVALDHRLVSPLGLRLGRLPASSGLGRVFSGMLRGVADALDALSPTELRPVELALTEFLVANLAAEGSPAARGGAEAARAAHFHRVCQTIETLLADPDLQIEQVAAADGISTRALQKLFAWSGQNFSTYLRTRRLERCRQDLASPISATLSISEICFRWGFNGSPHFSRAFKEQYGVTPREHRKAQLGAQGLAT